MNIKDILELYRNHTNHGELLDLLNSIEKNNVFLQGLSGSMPAIICTNIWNDLQKTFFIIAEDREEAAYFQNDLASFLKSDNDVLFFQSSFKRSIYNEIKDSGNKITRTDVLNNLSAKKNTPIIVSYPEAIMEKVASQKAMQNLSVKISENDSIGYDFLIEWLQDYNFERADFVYSPGQFAVRGSIIDIFSFVNDEPFRINFFGDEVETIHTFAIDTQLTLEKFQDVLVIPDIPESKLESTIFDYLPEDTILWLKDSQSAQHKVSEEFKKAVSKESRLELEEDTVPFVDFLLSENSISESFKKFTCVEFGNNSFFDNSRIIKFNSKPQPEFNKNFNILSQNLVDNFNSGYMNLIFSENEKQINRLQNIFNELNRDVEEFSGVLTDLHQGFIDNDLLLCCYTDHQIFERYHKYKVKSKFKKETSLAIKEITDISPGDFVVHADHGVGRFGGLQKIDVNGKMQEAIRLIYKDNDLLYVNIHSLHKISKFKSKDGEPPKIYKLGTNAWQKLKQKTKKKLKDIARELIALYARRKVEKGFAFSHDTYLQEELEASFIYEDTPDQLKCTQDVKYDMEANTPMDRLICGDVGFGKTEIAMRAAFKAVADSKQVAVLVPTTILALQHYKTFSDRLKDLPCTVDYVSRLKKSGDQKIAFKNLEEGKLDIIIGTHKLVGKEVKFKDLGLLIIDEEQKFGVAVKDKLKKIKLNVDTLTLSATPIPRTMQFSMMGARDLSVMTSPPPNRYPIATELHTFNEDIFRESIEYEIMRGGQVFVIHNRVQNIYELEGMINRILPKVKTVVGHGQMDGPKLEKIMLDFIVGDYDVLIATTIIENGLDIPNANTIIINNAHHFGLSDLHQLRGRVGRSNKKAFCYLISPHPTLLTAEAKRRLKAIEDFSELGSGFNIALQDLDIRGAGNLLGAEQSGFISDIGYETYHQILNDAIRELKETEFQDLYQQEQKELKQKRKAQKTEVSDYLVQDCQIDTDLELVFSDSYIENSSERMRLYRELNNISSESRLQKFESNLLNRFGEIPKETKSLIDVVRLKRVAMCVGVEKVILKRSKFIAHFPVDGNSPFYQTGFFNVILQQINTDNRFRMKKGDKLGFVIEKIDSVELAVLEMKKLADKSKKAFDNI